MKKVIFLLLFLSELFPLFSQNGKVDSLKLLVGRTKDPSVKISALNSISWEYFLRSDFDSVIKYAEEAIELNKSNYAELSSSYHHIGDAYYAKGDYENALEYNIKSLKASEKIKNNTGVLAAYSSIGTVYLSIGNLNKAEEFFLKSKDLSEQLNEKSGIANSLISLGNLAYMNGNYAKAEKLYLDALKLEIENKNKVNQALLYSNLGNIYYDTDSKKAADYYNQSTGIREEIKDFFGLADSYYNLGLLYTQLKNYDKALVYLDKAFAISNQIESKEALLNCYNGYSFLYESKGEASKALQYFQKYSDLKDTILNLESTKNINKLNALYETEKKNKTIELLNKDKEKQQALSEAKEQRNSIILISALCVILVVVSFSLSLYKKFKQTSKQKEIIESQKFEVEQQKHLIEEKQKEISDSINYAKRIQSSFMASRQEFEKFVDDYFIFFMPKDVVSGDFYWSYNHNDKFYLCVADSTGHGIPGAFMSLLNMSLLNEALFSKELSLPNEILDFVRRILIIGLKQDESGQGGNDGMDCSFVCIDKKLNKLIFAGANNPLWIVRDGNLVELVADKMPVGRSPKQDIPFSLQEFQLQINDQIYLFTDGLADQFGGPKGKKFKYKQLADLLIDESHLSEEEKCTRLSQSFKTWKGRLEQVDDVLVIGLKYK